MVAALLMQLLCITLGQTMDAEKPNEDMNRKKKKSCKTLRR